MCDPVRSNDGTAPYPLTTRSERSRKAREHKHRKILVRSCAVTFVGVSLSSYCVLSLTGNTEALLSAQEKLPPITFSAADHFPAWYEQLAAQVNQDADCAGGVPAHLQTLLAVMNASANIGQMKGLLAQIASGPAKETACIATYQKALATLQAAADEDEGNYMNAVASHDPSAVIASFARVAGWGQAALRSVEHAAPAVTQDMQMTTHCVADASNLYQAALQAAAAAAAAAAGVTQNVYGTAPLTAMTLPPTLPGPSVLQSVYATVPPAGVLGGATLGVPQFVYGLSGGNAGSPAPSMGTSTLPPIPAAPPTLVPLPPSSLGGASDFAASPTVLTSVYGPAATAGPLPVNVPQAVYSLPPIATPSQSNPSDTVMGSIYGQ